MRMALNLLISVVIAYCVVLALVFLFQSRLVFYPEIGREVTVTPQTYGLKFEQVDLPTADGETLHAWWVPADDARGTALFFHGNAGNISHRLDYLLMLNRMHFSTFIVDYRGYGKSTGKPSVEGTYRDAEAAWGYLRDARSVNPADLVIVGESLGGAVASWLGTRIFFIPSPSPKGRRELDGSPLHEGEGPGARAAPRALVLLSTFTSATDLGAQIYWFLPVRVLSRLDYDSARNLRGIRAPIFIAHSRDDDVIPFSHGRKLYELAGEPKVFLEMRGSHNEAFVFSRPEWSAQLASFLDRHPAR
jgi:fermentation-respiration switch protein FrsA (DUF1100 family)